MNGRIGLALALVLTGVSALVVVTIASQAGTAQPWSRELSDNFVFVRALPIVLGLGIGYGLIGGWTAPARRDARRAGGATRRFSGTTVALHALVAVGFVLALPTGIWQYLGGILDVGGPLPIYLYYRLHYIGAAIVLAAVTGFVTYWWMTGDRSLLVPRADWARSLRGFAQELPRPLGARLAALLRLDLHRPAGASGPFTFYERVFSFPTWAFGIALITVTGLVKLLRYEVAIPGEIVFVASTLHVTAMVILVIRTLDHLRYTFARWPLIVAIATGWLPERRGSVAAAAGESGRAEGAAGAGS